MEIILIRTSLLFLMHEEGGGTQYKIGLPKRISSLRVKFAPVQNYRKDNEHVLISLKYKSYLYLSEKYLWPRTSPPFPKVLCYLLGVDEVSVTKEQIIPHMFDKN